MLRNYLRELLCERVEVVVWGGNQGVFVGEEAEEDGEVEVGESGNGGEEVVGVHEIEGRDGRLLPLCHGIVRFVKVYSSLLATEVAKSYDPVATFLLASMLLWCVA